MKFRKQAFGECEILFIICFFKWDLKAYEITVFQQENALLTRTLSMTLRLRAKVLLHVWSYDFYNMSSPPNNNDVI